MRQSMKLAEFPKGKTKEADLSKDAVNEFL